VKVFRIALALLTWILICRGSQGITVDHGFEPNIGLTGPEVKFVVRGSNYTGFVAPAGATLRTQASILKMSLAGANPGAETVGLDRMDSTAHYLLGGQEQWHTNVAAYG